MNGKPVLHRDAKTVLSLDSTEFQEKMLCDALVFNPGDMCAYSCGFCYCPAMNLKLDSEILKNYNTANNTDLKLQDVVIRRKDVIGLIKGQLLKDGVARFSDPTDTRILFGSTTVDVAANMDLLRETAEACILIFEHTNWQVRLLSKSSLLHKLVQDNLVPAKYHQRLILGFSTGTLDDRVAQAIESGTSLVSKRLKSLAWLQNEGIRTFGMVCPSLPQQNYERFSQEICQAINVARCEHVWAEVINLRGESFTRTINGLQQAGLDAEAQSLTEVSADKAKWEDYARKTFLAHTQNVPPSKLRFLQYIGAETASWWAGQRPHGAVLIGRYAKTLQLTSLSPKLPTVNLAKPSIHESVIPSIGGVSTSDLQYRTEREEIVAKGVSASIAAAKALYEIYAYKSGALWMREHRSFADYCRANWDYSKAHAYRLVDSGSFIIDLERQSTNGDCIPRNEGQIRPVLIFPEATRVAVWKAAISGIPLDKLTADLVANRLRLHAASLHTKPLAARKSPSPKANEVASALSRLRKIASVHKKAPAIARLLNEIEALFGH